MSTRSDQGRGLDSPVAEARSSSSEVPGPLESMCLPGRALTLTEMMRVLDVLRRRLARATRGREGAFAGFDSLDVSKWDQESEAGSVVFTARLVADEGGSQVVEYVASRCDHRSGECGGVGPIYVSGVGRTIALVPATPVSAPRRFAIAAPRR